MTYLLIFFTLISGSFGAAVIWKKEFSKVLPITCMTIVGVLYIFGLFGFLYAGVIVLLAGFVLFDLYAAVALFVQKKTTPAEFRKNFFSFGFFFFIVLCALLGFCTAQLVASKWDEFSHWMDALKAMVGLNDFVTNPQSHAYFQSYPPSMTLFQYFLQELNLLIHPDAKFWEGLAYFAYQLFALSLLFPFFSGVSGRKPAQVILASTICLSPMIFFDHFYDSIYIDPFLGLLFGAAVARILLEKEKDWTYHAFIYLIIPTCVLAKDAGVFLAVFICAAYIADLWMNRRQDNKTVSPLLFAETVFSPVLMMAAKLSWNAEVARENANVAFSESFQIEEYLKLFFLHRDTSYRQMAVDNFKDGFFENRFEIGNMEFSISYFQLTILLGVLLLAAYCLLMKLPYLKQRKKFVTAILAGVFGQTVVYIFGLGITYLSKFTLDEAVKLASYNRYMNISFLGSFLVVILIFAHYLLNTQATVRADNRYLLQIVLSAVILCTAPMGNFLNFLERDCVREAIAFRGSYESIRKQIEDNCSGDSVIALIAQDRGMFDLIVAHFNARPNIMMEIGSWSFGSADSDGDPDKKEIPPQTYLQMLKENNVEFVAIQNSNEYFEETYAELFENPQDIAGQTLFYLDEETEKLKKCESK